MQTDTTSQPVVLQTFDNGDQLRQCRDCSIEFVLPAKESDYFVLRGLSVPRRCQHCRRTRRAERGLA